LGAILKFPENLYIAQIGAIADDIGCNFRSHDFPSGLASATAMPRLKIRGLREKRGNSDVEFPLFSASIAARIPI
jgi:hypothetical protein